MRALTSFLDQVGLGPMREKKLSQADSESDGEDFDLPLRPFSDFQNARLEKVFITIYYTIGGFENFP